MRNYNHYVLGIVALAIGLFIGYFIFSPKDSMETPAILQEEASTEEIWTCSMHPQIRQSEPGNCPICGMDLIPATSSEGTNEFGFQMTEEAVQLANIQTTIIGPSASNEENQLHLNGKIQADETQAASLVSHIPGRIEKLFISFKGERVDQGQKIATIYSPELITAQKELLEAQKISDISPGLLDAAKNKLKYWKIHEQVIDEILNTGLIRENFNIYAEHSGIVAQRRVSVGDYLSTGEVLFDIQDLNSVWALFDVYESDLSKIRIGSYIFFTTPSILNKTFKAKITFIDPVINSNTRVTNIRAEVNNTSHKLKPEMFIKGKLHVSKNNTTISVPKTAVLWTGQRSVVYIKNPNATIPSFEYREIELGQSTGSAYAVSSGLDVGEEVVTNGAFIIDASSQLNNQVSMMNKNVMAKNTQHTSHLPDFTSTTPQAFKQQLNNLVMSYLPLKDALVASDVKETINHASASLSAAAEVDMTIVKGEPHIFWMEQLKAIQSHGSAITNSQDIEEQRKQFDFLSQALIKSIKVFGVDHDTFYVQHCPMANDNDGAAWLSAQMKILNPYFGEKMLTCGSIQDTIDKYFKNPPMQQQPNQAQTLHSH
jgi:Cu(I)/Ag(I) efflux system membrane fusion protein